MYLQQQSKININNSSKIPQTPTGQT